MRSLLKLLFGTALLAAPAARAETAVWLRPPATPEALTRAVEDAKAAGFTDVLLEGFYHGRAAWASSVAPPKLGYDAVSVAEDAARRVGLKLSVWIETTYWRPAPSFGIPVTPLWRDESATRTADGRVSLDLSKLGFVDPADPYVRDTLIRLVRELASQHPSVGLHLDYLRYPREADFGYGAAAVAAYAQQTGTDPRTLKRLSPDGVEVPAWRDWAAWRRDQVTRLAGDLIRNFREAGGRGLVSAAVFGGTDSLQDWRSWTGLQAAMPMFYFPSPNLYSAVLWAWPKGAGIWPGIQVGPGYPPLRVQLDLMHATGYPNVAVFGWTPGLR